MRELPHYLVFGDTKSDFVSVVQYLLASRWVVIAVFLAFILGGLAISLFSTPMYRSFISIYVSNSDNNMQSLGKLSGITSSLGLNSNDSALVIDITDLANSRRVRQKVLDQTWPCSQSNKHVTLYELWGLTDKELSNTELKEKINLVDRAMKRLKLAISISKRPTGLIIISVSMPDPVTAQSIASFLGEYLRTEYVTIKQTNIRAEREFISDRIDTVLTELEDAETALVEFKISNKSFQQSPLLVKRFTSLKREVELLGQLYMTLRPQFELAKIEEIRNKPMIEVLDHAQIPAGRYKPQRANIVIMYSIFGLFSGICFAFIVGYFQFLRINVVTKRGSE